MKKIIFMTILVLASLFIVTFIFAIVAESADRPLLKRQPVQTKPSVTTTQPPPDEIQTVVPADRAHPAVEAKPADAVEGAPPSDHIYEYAGRMFKYETVGHCGIQCKMQFTHLYDTWSATVDGFSDLEVLSFFSSNEDICQEFLDLCERGGRQNRDRCGPRIENFSRFDCTVKYKLPMTKCNGIEMGYEVTDLECP